MLLVEEERENGGVLTREEEADMADDGGILEDCNTEHEGNEEHVRKSPQTSTTSTTSMFGNLTVFRDFFLAAFSDGYNSTFCGMDDVNCCKGSAKVAPAESSLKGTGVASSSFDAGSIQQTASQQDAKRRRKKPLAVAVGFNYTKDVNGRPIVITPTGTRNSPIDLTNVRCSPPRPPPALPVLNKPFSQSPPPSVPNLRSRLTSGYAVQDPSLSY